MLHFKCSELLINTLMETYRFKLVTLDLVLYNLTSSRKKMGKAIARGSRISIATQCLNDESISKHIIKKVGSIIHSEVVALCSGEVNSKLRYCSRDDLLNFQRSNIYDELQQHAPTYLPFKRFYFPPHQLTARDQTEKH